MRLGAKGAVPLWDASKSCLAWYDEMKARQASFTDKAKLIVRLLTKACSNLTASKEFAHYLRIWAHLFPVRGARYLLPPKTALVWARSEQLRFLPQVCLRVGSG